MGFLDSLFGSQDPTKNWPRTAGATPDFNLKEKSLGVLRFGDPVESAQFLGRPDRFRRRSNGFFQLLYAQAGFQIEFEGGQFAQLIYYIAPAPGESYDTPIAYCRPRLSNGPQFTPETNRPEVERLFGKPDIEDDDPENMVLYYTKDDISLEFEFGETGLLCTVFIYPED